LVLEATKGSSIACFNLAALCSAARHTWASRHPSAAAARPYGPTALRGPTAPDPDTPARSAARCDRRSAAAPQHVGITSALSPAHHHLDPPAAGRKQTRRSRQSRTATPAPYRAAISARSGSESRGSGTCSKFPWLPAARRVGAAKYGWAIGIGGAASQIGDPGHIRSNTSREGTNGRR
jgi:hypothetical protein